MMNDVEAPSMTCKGLGKRNDSVAIIFSSWIYDVLRVMLLFPNPAVLYCLVHSVFRQAQRFRDF